MKKTVLLYILLALLFGFFVGLSVPFSYSLCTKGCPTPLLQVCEHGFWDWTLRVLQVIGPIAAVIVALFKEDWVAYWYTPSLHIETSMDDLGEQLVRDGENDVASTYTAMLRYSNIGKATANNMSIFVERVIYRQSSDSLTSEDLLGEPFALLLDKGNDSINLPRYGEKSVVWLSLQKVKTPSAPKGKPIVPSLYLFIGRSFQIPPKYSSGIFDVTFKVACDNLKPQLRTVRLQWDGMWRSRKQELFNGFAYKWLEN